MEKILREEEQLCPGPAVYQKINREAKELQELNQKWSERFGSC